MSNSSLNSTLHLIKEKEPLDKVVMHYLSSIEKDGTYQLIYSLSDILGYIQVSLQKKNEIKHYCDFLYEQLSKYFTELDVNAGKTIFNYYLEYPHLSDKWNILSFFSLEQQYSIIYSLLPESKILDKLKKKKINLSFYTNEYRDNNIDYNLREKCLLNLLYSHYPQRKSRVSLFNYVSEEFKHLNIDNDVIKLKLKIENVFSQNFLNLPENIKNQLNENIYEQKINNTKHQLNTEACIIYNVLTIAAKSFLQYGYFYSPQGVKLHTSEDFSNVYMQNPVLNNLMQDFLLLKIAKAQIPNSKKFWLDLSINIKNEKKAPELRKPRMKI